MLLAFVFIADLASLVGVAHGDTAAAFTFQTADVFGGGAQLQAEKTVEGLADLRQGDPVLRAFGPGEAGFDFVHVQGQGVGEHRFLARQTP
ncbi:hypothetical protein D3C80_1351280 [compost metagenome]